MHLINCESTTMSHAESHKHEDNELLEDWTFVDHSEYTHFDEEEQNDEDSIEGAVAPPEEEEEEEEEVVTEEEEEVVQKAEGQKVEEIEDDEESLKKKVRKRKGEKSEEKGDKETDTAEDVPQTESDHGSSLHEDMNKRLNGIVVAILVVISLLGLGHFIGWTSRSLWEQSLNAAQILEKLKIENEELQERILDLQAENIEPIKIKGREGKEGRSLREKLNHLIGENEDMRLALSRHQFSALPDGDKNEFNKASQENHHLRKTVQQLIHLVPDFSKLEDSFEFLTTEHTDLLKTVGKIRHEQTIPKELTPMVKQLEEMRSVVAAEIKKKNPPSTIANARSYIAYMSQVLSAFTFLHDLEEKSAADKIDIAKDIFSYWMPKGVNVPPKMQDEVVKARSQFTAVKSSLRKKWKQLKELTKPETIISVGQSTVAKMNRVIVNVVTKLKEIGQSTIMSTNKQFEQSVLALSSGLSKLNRQFDETWKSLEIRISMGERDDEDSDSGYDDNGEQNNDDDNEDDDIEGDEENENEKEASEKEIQRKESIIDINEKIAKDKNEGPHSQADTKSKAKAQTDESHKSPLESEEIKVEIQKQIKNKEFEKISGIVEKKRENQKEKKITPNIKKERSDRSQNLKQSVVEEKVVVHHRKDRNVEEEEEPPRDHKKESKISLKDKIKEKKQEQKLMKEDSRYFKGQYNKFDKVRDATDKEVPDFTRKYYRQNDFDDDDDDDDDDHQVSKKSSGLKRHWEKPQKKSFFREQSGPKKQFIRRRGDF